MLTPDKRNGNYNYIRYDFLPIRMIDVNKFPNTLFWSGGEEACCTVESRNR